jgi:hypothetical protein
VLWQWYAQTDDTTLLGFTSQFYTAGPYNLHYTDINNIQQISPSTQVTSTPALAVPGAVVTVTPATVAVLSVTDNGDGTATWVFDTPGSIADPTGGNYQVTDTGMDNAGESAIVQVDPYTYIMTFPLDPRGWPFTYWLVNDLAADIDFSPHVISTQAGAF